MEENGRSHHSFWQAIETAVNPGEYRPHRHHRVEVARLSSNGRPYYVLKQPDTKSYLRLSESDYALWWQMNGRRTLKEILFYSLRRYHTLPIGHLNGLINDLRNGGFLYDNATNIYQQLESALDQRAPASRGRRLLNGFLYSEASTTGLDDFFTPLYTQVQWLYSGLARLLLLLLVLCGGGLFIIWFWSGKFALTGQGALSVVGLFVANLIVITIHELAHGLMTKHYGRELDRGGFLLYWGIPAFFVDTRDTWMLPSRARIAVSWAGPYSGLVLGGLAGLALTAVVHFQPSWISPFWQTLIFQIGFIGYLSAFINLNPLLELDGYFMLMDGLEMPGLRQRAFRFWREAALPQLRQAGGLHRFWQALSRTDRIFLLFGALALAYTLYALRLALFFWRSRLEPIIVTLWTDYGVAGKLLLLALTAVLIIPSIYALLQYGYRQMQRVLAWLANRDLLARPDVLAVLLGVPLLGGIALLYVWLGQIENSAVWRDLLTGLLHLATIGGLVGVARQLPGSRFQWALWTLVAAPVGLMLAWLTAVFPFWHDLSLIGVAFAILAAGIIAWFTVSPNWLTVNDRLLMGLMVLGAPLSYLLMTRLFGSAMAQNGRWLASATILFATFLGLMFLSPLLLNFRHSRFALSWYLLLLALLLTPWLQFEPLLHIPVIAVWLYAVWHYLVVGELAQFSRTHFEEIGTETAVYDEHNRLIASFNNFMNALFGSYEAIFGGRRLSLIQEQIAALEPLDPDGSIIQTADKGQQALLLAVDRLDDLAGTPFTRQAGQAAYDSLPWLQAETLARHILSNTDWGSQLAQGFIHVRDKRAELLRRADIFAGFDQEGVTATLQISRMWSGRDSMIMAQQHQEATSFYLIESGEVAILHNGEQVGKLTPGGYFGTNALLDSGQYQFTYRTLTRVRALVIDRHKFDPLLRADTTLSQQVNSGAAVRRLLKRMPLFSSLSPQQLATIDAKLVQRSVTAGDIVVRQGEPRSHLFIVAKGAIETVAQYEGQAEIIGRLGPGEHFGEYALFADTPYQATYRAAADSQLLLLDEPTFDALVAQYERMSHYVEQIGSGRLVITRRRLGVTAVLS